MAQTTGTTEEIIEKRDTSPVALSCIIVATVALVGAIFLELYEVGELTASKTASTNLSPADKEQLGAGRFESVIRRRLKGHESKVQTILADADVDAVVDLDEYNQILGRAEGAPVGLPGSGSGGADAGAGDDVDEKAFGDDDDEEAFGDDDDEEA